jgi:hypothetical protein
MPFRRRTPENPGFPQLFALRPAVPGEKLALFPGFFARRGQESLCFQANLVNLRAPLCFIAS